MLIVPETRVVSYHLGKGDYRGGRQPSDAVVGLGLDPGDWWVVSQGSNGEGGKKGKKGKKRKREQEGGTFRVAGELLFRTREEAEAHLREALGEGDDGDDEGGEGGDKGGGGVARGVRWGVTREVRGRGHGG